MGRKNSEDLTLEDMQKTVKIDGVDTIVKFDLILHPSYVNAAVVSYVNAKGLEVGKDTKGATEVITYPVPNTEATQKYLEKFPGVWRFVASPENAKYTIALFPDFRKMAQADVESLVKATAKYKDALVEAKDDASTIIRSEFCRQYTTDVRNDLRQNHVNAEDNPFKQLKNAAPSMSPEQIALTNQFFASLGIKGKI